MQKGGGGLFAHYSSLEEALRAIYPGFPWDAGSFISSHKVKKGHWQDKKNLLDALDSIANKLGIKEVCVDLHSSLPTRGNSLFIIFSF